MPPSSIFSWGVRTRQSLRLPAIRLVLPLFHIMLYARVPADGVTPIGNASALLRAEEIEGHHEPQTSRGTDAGYPAHLDAVFVVIRIRGNSRKLPLVAVPTPRGRVATVFS